MIPLARVNVTVGIPLRATTVSTSSTTVQIVVALVNVATWIRDATRAGVDPFQAQHQTRSLGQVTDTNALIRVVLTLVLVTVGEDGSGLAVSFVFGPLATIHSTRGMSVHAEAVAHAVFEMSLVNVAVDKRQDALA